MERISSAFAFLIVVTSMSSLVVPARGLDLKTLRHYETVTVEPRSSGNDGRNDRRRRRSAWTLNETDDTHLEDAEFVFRGNVLSSPNKRRDVLYRFFEGGKTIK